MIGIGFGLYPAVMAAHEPDRSAPTRINRKKLEAIIRNDLQSRLPKPGAPMKSFSLCARFAIAVVFLVSTSVAPTRRPIPNQNRMLTTSRTP